MYLLLVGSQALERAALRRLFEQDTELYLVGETAEIDSLLARVEVVQPDLVLLDWELPGSERARLLQILHSLGHPLKVVAFSSRPEVCQEAVAAGVDACVSREEPVEELLKTVRAVGGLSPYAV